VLERRPVRSLAPHPIIPVVSVFSAVRWIWTDFMVHRGIADRVGDSVKAAALSPLWYAEELSRVARGWIRRR
jgi:hypothetical protein